MALTLNTLVTHSIHRALLSSMFVFLGALLLSKFSEQFVRKSTRPVGETQTLRTALRYGLTVFVVIGLCFVWAEEVKHLFYAAAALFGAILLVSKEFIMCILGNVIKYHGKLCPIGQVVVIDGIKGQVIDSGFLTIKLQEIEHSFSGKIISFPNSIFLSKPITNLSMTGEYCLVFVRIPVLADSELDALSKRLLAIVTELVAPYQKEAEKHLDATLDALLMEFPSMAPRVLLEPKDYREVCLAARFICPANQRSTLEQDILLQFYTGLNRNLSPLIA